MSECRKRNELIVRAFDIDLRQLLGCQTLHAFHLRNDFVTLTLDTETIHIIPAEQRRKVLAGLAQINPLRAELVPVEDYLGLRLVKLQIGVGIDEDAALERTLHQLVRELRKLLRLSRRSDDEVHGKISTAG